MQALRYFQRGIGLSKSRTAYTPVSAGQNNIWPQQYQISGVGTTPSHKSLLSGIYLKFTVRCACSEIKPIFLFNHHQETDLSQAGNIQMRICARLFSAKRRRHYDALERICVEEDHTRCELDGQYTGNNEAY